MTVCLATQFRSIVSLSGAASIVGSRVTNRLVLPLLALQQSEHVYRQICKLCYDGPM